MLTHVALQVAVEHGRTSDASYSVCMLYVVPATAVQWRLFAIVKHHETNLVRIFLFHDIKRFKENDFQLRHEHYFITAKPFCISQPNINCAICISYETTYLCKKNATIAILWSIVIILTHKLVSAAGSCR